ncbi:hypothetical protein AB0M43_01535 [Longispora sp. NPDC051575]|uniref:hypothetical protein n=1 Tax=Longispora sp. NPDC051575 TaxID=3154943 RepID=UPI0034145FBB
MSTPVYFATIGLFLGTILAVFAMRYVAANRRAKAQLAQELTYRDLAAAATATQAETAAAVTAVQAGLADISARLGAIEKTLKEFD